jgi:hypothetical protein
LQIEGQEQKKQKNYIPFLFLIKGSPWVTFMELFFVHSLITSNFKFLLIQVKLQLLQELEFVLIDFFEQIVFS